MNHPHPARRFAFTLVELLVVIGIIALLISVLLPVLASVRRQAAAVKCETALREIGNCFAFYAQENKGHYPPCKCFNYRISLPHSNPPVDYTADQWWMVFLAKYATHGKINKTATNVQDAAESMKSIFWGCPAFTAYSTTSTYDGVNGVNVVQTGYGMNAFPEYTATFPSPTGTSPNLIGDSLGGGSTPAAPYAVFSMESNDAWATPDNFRVVTGRGQKWYRQSDYTHPAERALVADCGTYVLEAQSTYGIGAIPGQTYVQGSVFWSSGAGFGQTSYDFYRHGKYPKMQGTDFFSSTGGKIAYNVLFADGHVKTLTAREEGYKVARMRFPG